MNKQEFISILEKRLEELPQLEKEHILNFYNETIEDRMEDGMEEEEAIESLGSMEELMEQLPLEKDPVQMKKTADTNHRVWRIALLILLCPFWIALLALILLLYVLSWILLAVLLVFDIACIFYLAIGLWRLIPICIANGSAGMILLGSIVLIAGLLPLSWKLLKISRNKLYEKTPQWYLNIKNKFEKVVK